MESLMETLGSLLDKYSIARNRHHSMTNDRIDIPEELIEKVDTQIKDLQDEITSYVSSAVKGDVVLEEPKYKIYKGEKPSNEQHKTLGEAMGTLFKSNWELWCLEDKRREKKRSDEEIRQICDDVATKNRVRNDCMDEINKILKKMIDTV